MGVEDGADLAAFFDPDEFGEPAILTPAAGGDPVALSVLFDERGPAGRLNHVHRPDDRATSPQIRVPVAALGTAIPDAGDQLVLTRRGRTYRVVRAPRDKSGTLYEIELSEA